MGKVYTDYFQKSKVFLYPLLGIKKGIAFVPKQTYIAWEHVYAFDNYKLLCEYNTKMNDTFTKFSYRYLENHPLYEDHIKLEEGKQLYIFNFKSHKPDLIRFKKGLYSQFSLDAKITILDFFGDQGKVSEYIHTFLTPSDGFDDYAKFLDIDVKTLEDIGELCSKPDLEKETLVDNNQFLYQLLKNSSIYLSKSK